MDGIRGLERSLLATLNYFDLFDHPLTLMELVRYRYGSLQAAPAISDIALAIDRLGVGERDGYFFLPGREAIAAARQRRHRLAEPLYRRARRAARLMRLLPSVRLVAVCNSLAIANADRESDVDLFVVARSGTVWVTRLLVVGTLALFGLRPTGRTSAGRICMSFFVSERALDLEPLALHPDDTYLRYWITSLVPLHDAGGVMGRFLTANAWVTERVPGAAAPRRARADGQPLLDAPLAYLLQAAESAARSLQQRLFPEAIRAAAAAECTSVVVSDDVLKFHVDDRRAEFERAFRNRLAALETRGAAETVSAVRHPQATLLPASL